MQDNEEDVLNEAPKDATEDSEASDDVTQEVSDEEVTKADLDNVTISNDLIPSVLICSCLNVK